MLEQTESTLDELDSAVVDNEELEEVETKRLRLKNLHESIKIQLTRLERQIDYIKVNIEMRRIEKQLNELDEDDIDNDTDRNEAEKLHRRLNELEKKNENLITLMKDANRRSLQQQQATNSSDSENGRRVENEGSFLKTSIYTMYFIIHLIC